MPVIVQRGAQFACGGRRHLRRGADADSYGPSIQKNIEILQLQYIDKMIDIWVCRSCSSSVQSWRRQLSSHSCADLRGHCRCHARRCATTAALVQTSENCAGPAVAVLLRGRCPCCAGSSWRPVLDKVVDMPVIVNDRVLHSGGASNSVHRLFFVDIPVVQHRRVRRFQHFWLWRR